MQCFCRYREWEGAFSAIFVLVARLLLEKLCCWKSWFVGHCNSRPILADFFCAICMSACLPSRGLDRATTASPVSREPPAGHRSNANTIWRSFFLLGVIFSHPKRHFSRFSRAERPLIEATSFSRKNPCTSLLASVVGSATYFLRARRCTICCLCEAGGCVLTWSEV